MSAQPVETSNDAEESADSGIGHDDHTLHEPVPVQIRRNGLVSALLGATASAIAIAYLWRAAESGSVLDWVLCAVLGLVGAVFLHSLLDGRTPLLVADELGVRIRLGTTWRGLPWDAIERVVVRPRRGFLRDGTLVVQLTQVARSIEGLEGRARRHALVNRKVYGGHWRSRWAWPPASTAPTASSATASRSCRTDVPRSSHCSSRPGRSPGPRHRRRPTPRPSRRPSQPRTTWSPRRRPRPGRSTSRRTSLSRSSRRVLAAGGCAVRSSRPRTRSAPGTRPVTTPVTPATRPRRRRLRSCPDSASCRSGSRRARSRSVCRPPTTA